MLHIHQAFTEGDVFPQTNDTTVGGGAAAIAGPVCWPAPLRDAELHADVFKNLNDLNAAMITSDAQTRTRAQFRCREQVKSQGIVYECTLGVGHAVDHRDTLLHKGS